MWCPSIQITANGLDAVVWITGVTLEEQTCFMLSKVSRGCHAKVSYYWAMLVSCCGGRAVLLPSEHPSYLTSLSLLQKCLFDIGSIAKLW